MATAAGPVAQPRGDRQSLPAWVTSVIGIVIVLVVWQVLGATVFHKSGTVPTPTRIASQIHKDGFPFYWNNAAATIGAACKGWLWGNLLAIVLALIVLIIPLFERPLLQLGVASYCLPVVAVGPLFAVVFSVNTSKVILAAMSVFFTTLIGALVGLRSADITSLDVVHAYGGGS